MIPFIKEYLLNNWTSLGLGEKPEELLFVKYADRGIRAAEVGLITCLVKKIKHGLEAPALILRFPRYYNNAEAYATLKNEHNNLVLLGERLCDPSLKAAIPESIVWKNLQQCPVLGMSWLTGQPMSYGMISSFILKTFLQKYGLAFNWLLKFQKQLITGNTVFLLDLLNSSGKVYEEQGMKMQSAAEKYFYAAQEKAQRAAVKKIPLIPQHCDFHAENVFVSVNHVSGVIDWEDFTLDGIPGFDFFHFIKTYFEAIFNHFSATGKPDLIEEISLGQPVKEALAKLAVQYFALFDIAEEIVPILLVLYLFNSFNLAASSRKRALASARKLDLLLQLGPLSVESLLYYVSLEAYATMYGNAVRQKNASLAERCSQKMREIKTHSLR